MWLKNVLLLLPVIGVGVLLPHQTQPSEVAFTSNTFQIIIQDPHGEDCTDCQHLFIVSKNTKTGDERTFTGRTIQSDDGSTDRPSFLTYAFEDEEFQYTLSTHQGLSISTEGVEVTQEDGTWSKGPE